MPRQTKATSNYNMNFPNLKLFLHRQALKCRLFENSKPTFIFVNEKMLKYFIVPESKLLQSLSVLRKRINDFAYGWPKIALQVPKIISSQKQFMLNGYRRSTTSFLLQSEFEVDERGLSITGVALANHPWVLIENGGYLSLFCSNHGWFCEGLLVPCHFSGDEGKAMD